MLRRTPGRMMLRRTAPRLHGDSPQPFKDLSEVPPGDTTIGSFGFPYAGGLAPLRFLDIGWYFSRLTDLRRDGVIGGGGFYIFLWCMWWVLPMYMLYGDGKPPQQVDWNAGKAGYLKPKAE
eukprot:PhM_4_TR4353/c1_g1_i1/m.19254